MKGALATAPFAPRLPCPLVHRSARGSGCAPCCSSARARPGDEAPTRGSSVAKATAATLAEPHISDAISPRPPSTADAHSARDGSGHRLAVYAANAGVLAGVALGAANGSGVMAACASLGDPGQAIQHASALFNEGYTSLNAAHPILLKVI